MQERNRQFLDICRQMIPTIKHIPSAQGYSVMTPLRHGFDNASCAGANNYKGQRWLLEVRSWEEELTWMNAVPRTTPEPRFLIAENTKPDALTALRLATSNGSHAPMREAIMITNIEEIRSGRWPLNSFPVLQVDIVVVAIKVSR